MSRLAPGGSGGTGCAAAGTGAGPGRGHVGPLRQRAPDQAADPAHRQRHRAGGQEARPPGCHGGRSVGRGRAAARPGAGLRARPAAGRVSRAAGWRRGPAPAGTAAGGRRQPGWRGRAPAARRRGHRRGPAGRGRAGPPAARTSSASANAPAAAPIRVGSTSTAPRSAGSARRPGRSPRRWPAREAVAQPPHRRDADHRGRRPPAPPGCR